MGQGDNEEGEQKLPPQNGSSGTNSSKKNMVLSHLRERVHDAMSSSTSRFIHKHLQRRHTPKEEAGDGTTVDLEGGNSPSDILCIVQRTSWSRQALTLTNSFLAEPSDVTPEAELPPSFLVVGGDHDVLADTLG